MITTCIIALAIAAIVISVNPRNASLRWLSAAFFSGSLMIVVFLVDKQFPDAPHVLINAMIFVTDVLLALTLGMFGVVYSGRTSRKTRGQMLSAGVALIFVTFLLTPLSPTRRINYAGHNEVPVVSLVVLFLLVGISFLIASYVTERHPYKRIERSATNFLMIPLMLAVAISYIAYSLEIDLFRYNYLFAVGFLMVFVTLGLKQGVLGVKFRIAMLQADASIRLLDKGSSLLNHAVKNEIGKIDILVHQARQSLQQNRRNLHTSGEELERMLALAADSVQHIQAMLDKIHEHVQAIEVRLVKADISSLLEECAATFIQSAEDTMSIDLMLDTVPEIYYDPVHVKEVIYNLLANAAEAMNEQGTIRIILWHSKEGVVVQIQDEGKGIPKQTLPFVFDPYYSTNSMRSHYGLGLYYCKNVMDKHDGSIHIESVEGEGTSVFLTFRLQQKSRVQQKTDLRTRAYAT